MIGVSMRVTPFLLEAQNDVNMEELPELPERP